MSAETNLQVLLKSMNPILHEGEYVFCTLRKTDAIDPNDLVMTFSETEGTTIILRKDIADNLNLKYDFVAAWITLTVHSSLEAVGLTAAFATALSQKGISCNVVSGYYHDHLFVSVKNAERAMEALNSISG